MIDSPGSADITGLLIDWRNGDQAALEQLITLVHEELRRLARRHMAHERVGHTLQATALVNEAFVRLIDVRQVKWQDRAQFFAMSSRLMRQILVDFARSKGYKKRRLSDVDGDAELDSPTRPGWPAERCRSDADRQPSARICPCCARATSRECGRATRVPETTASPSPVRAQSFPKARS